ncbi:hypothetical protein RB653_001374 [Dictyostelium firmibasis]|uniref:PIN domain-containing protein n=1 Tax=Dictyostelium firmibasis TaxID=79012 RepID=A0AAN7TYE7_9MYCE
MKIKRQKLYKKTIQFYKTNYSYKEPFSVLMDPGFIKKCLNMNIFFKEALPKLLESKVSFFITPCCIAEMKRNPKEYSNDLISTCKRIEYYQCDHKHSSDEQNMVQKCFTDISIKQSNTFFFAVQDHDHRLILRKNPGIPILFVLTNLIILEKPATSSYQTMIKTHKAITQINPREKQMLLKLKHGENYNPDTHNTNSKQKQITPTNTTNTPTKQTKALTTTTTTTTSSKQKQQIPQKKDTVEIESKKEEVKKVEQPKDQTLKNDIKEIKNDEKVEKPNLKRKLDIAENNNNTITNINNKSDNNDNDKPVSIVTIPESSDNSKKTKQTKKSNKDEKLTPGESALEKEKLEQNDEEKARRKQKWIEERKKLREKKLKKKEAIKKAIEIRRKRIESGDTHKRTRRKRSQTGKIKKTQEKKKN